MTIKILFNAQNSFLFGTPEQNFLENVPCENLTVSHQKKYLKLLPLLNKREISHIYEVDDDAKI